MIGGDFNARTEMEGGWRVEEWSKQQTRESEYEKKDENGEGMLEYVRKMGMEILNGNVKGDIDILRSK